MQQFILAVCVTCMVLAGTNRAEDCMYRLQQCNNRMNNMELHVNSVEAKQAIIESRQSAIARELLREMNLTKQDTKAVKTVVNTLVEDNVKMHGEMRMLNGVGYDIMNLRQRVDGFTKKMTSEVEAVKGEVNKVSQSVQKDSEAQIKVTAYMSSQMNKNNQLLQELQSRFTGVEERVNSVERSAPSGGAATEHLQGMMDEISSRLDGFEDYYGKKIINLEKQLEQLRSQL